MRECWTVCCYLSYDSQTYCNRRTDKLIAVDGQTDRETELREKSIKYINNDRVCQIHLCGEYNHHVSFV